MNPIIISIEGNIGAGKSTIFNQLQQYYSTNLKIVFMKEPVDIWSEVKDDDTNENILVKYYNNPSKYAFGFQIMVYSAQCKLYKQLLQENPQCEIIISERSMDAGRNVFAQMLKHDGCIDDIHYKIYNSLYDVFKYDLKYIFYISVNPEICLRRTIQRNREGESSISINYLQKCKDYYDSWINNLSKDETTVISINGNQDDNGTYCVNNITNYIDKQLLVL
jgi:deoxycitidine kinase/deoxyguanosine kinase